MNNAIRFLSLLLLFILLLFRFQLGLLGLGDKYKHLHKVSSFILICSMYAYVT